MSGITATTISLSWSVSSGSVVDSYVVVWERSGSATITDGSTSYTMMGLKENSSYTVTVTSANTAGSAVSCPVTLITREPSEYITTHNITHNTMTLAIRRDTVQILLLVLETTSLNCGGNQIEFLNTFLKKQLKKLWHVVFMLYFLSPCTRVLLA